MGPELKNGGVKNIPGRKPFLSNLLTLVYRCIFREEMSADVRLFIKNLLYVSSGSLISLLFSSIFTIMGGKILGPEEYGKFILIQSIAMFLYIPMLLGFSTAMLKYMSEKPDPARQSSIISTTYILVLLFTACSIGIYILFKSKLAVLFSISQDLFELSIGFAVSFVFYVITTSVLRGLDKTREYAAFQIVYAAILLVSFLFFFLYRSTSFTLMVYPMLIAYGISGIFIFILFTRKFIKWEFHRSWAKILFKYALFAVIGALSSVLYINMVRIMISRYMTVADVGIYSAYYTASVNVINIFWGIFSIVYFPAISKYESKRIIFKRINKLMPYLFGLGIPFIMICEFIVLKLYGSQYPINISLMLLFAISSVLTVSYGLLNWTFASQGIRGMKLDNIGNVSVAISAVVLSIFLIPLLGLYGAATVMPVSFSIGIFWLSILTKRLS